MLKFIFSNLYVDSVHKYINICKYGVRYAYEHIFKYNIRDELEAQLKQNIQSFKILI